MGMVYEPRLLVPASGVLELVQNWQVECVFLHSEGYYKTKEEFKSAYHRYDYYFERATKELKTFTRKIEAN